LNEADLETIRRALASGTGEALPLKVPVAPRLQTLEFLAERTGKDRLDSLLKTFSSLPERDQLFGKADITGMLELAAHPKARASGLPLRDLLVLCNCPVTQKEPSHLGAWISWVEALERNQSCPLPPLESRLDAAADTPQDLHGAERDGRLLGAYKWMHYHFPEAFPDLAGANRELGRLNQYILASLQKRLQAVCHDCGRKLPTNWRSRQCRTCTEVPPPSRGRPRARFQRNRPPQPSKHERKPELAGASQAGTFRR